MRTIDRQGLGMTIGLAVQYILGMTINLFVVFPAGKSAGWSFTLHNMLVLTHLVIGTLLLVNGIVIVVSAFKRREHTWKLPAWSGLVWLLVTWGAGEAFVSDQSDVMSYLMAIGTLFAILSYAAGIYRSRTATANA